jgi:hypothetical protein
MASILRKLIISMLIPYLWRRWRDRGTRQAATPATRPAAPGLGGRLPAPTDARG